jgi:hypothetical protein
MLLGCNNGAVDDCGNVGIDPCVTFHLSAASDLSDAFVTAIAMWVTFNIDGIQLENKLLQTQMQAATHFPIAVGLDLPTDLSDSTTVRIEALLGPGVAAYSVASVMPSINQHIPVNVTMQAPSVSGCFNNSFDSGESDVDCGGRCPPCASGRRCITDADCQSASCPAAGGFCN